MNGALDRRSFLVGALTTPWLAGRWAVTTAAETPPHQPMLDLHVHLFGVGEGGTGCRMSDSITEGMLFRSLVGLLGLRVPGKTLDERYEEKLVEDLKSSGLTKAAIVGQDAVYDRHGQPDWDRTGFYVPNDYVFAVVARHSECMVPCPSINPNRADALEELVRCHEKGARLLKIHPPTQGVDVADRKHSEFFRRCCELDLVVLVHTGHEHSAPVIDKTLAAPRRLELALDQGCTVVACHAGTGWITDEPDYLPEFATLLKRYPKLWGDTAVLATAGRVRDFRRLLDGKNLLEGTGQLEDEVAFVRSRLLHGSDFPFPAAPTCYVDRIGMNAALRLAKEANLLKKDLELKEALGIGYASAQRAYEVAKAGQNINCCGVLKLAPATA